MRLRLLSPPLFLSLLLHGWGPTVSHTFDGGLLDPGVGAEDAGKEDAGQDAGRPDAGETKKTLLRVHYPA